MVEPHQQLAIARPAMSASAALDLTVVIPTFNGAARLPAVLAHLAAQVETAEITWEIVVVDNNSSDKTAEVVQQHQATWQHTAPLRYVFEPMQGLAYARQCGIDAAHGRLVGFLDDDNWPAADWAIAAVQFAAQHPKAAAYGGKIAGIFETEPSPEVKPLLRFLAVRDLGPKPKPFNPDKMQFPPGAGLVVRRSVWLETVPRQLLCISRGGDDYEISMRMARHGWEIWYAPTLQIQHCIPASRLERSYLKKLAHFYGLCTCQLTTIQVPYWQQPAVLGRAFLGSLKRILLHYASHRWHSRKTLEADCQLAFHYGNLKSPFAYVLGQLQRDRKIPSL